jgi:hypothetical protein
MAQKLTGTGDQLTGQHKLYVRYSDKISVDNHHVPLSTLIGDVEPGGVLNSLESGLRVYRWSSAQSGNLHCPHSAANKVGEQFMRLLAPSSMLAVFSTLVAVMNMIDVHYSDTAFGVCTGF